MSVWEGGGRRRFPLDNQLWKKTEEEEEEEDISGNQMESNLFIDYRFNDSKHIGFNP